ncbi:zinc knuckle [Ancylostoma caninum]|uniref:Zinc knuckle n=1 Tax=Ancylostoma caninum TaxID=29170 RepID=A0A368G520_ANCCA|nr:zinc knuckle [Ancylostoma caninum]
MVINAKLTELETQMAILNLGKPKEMHKNAPHSSIKGHYSQHMDDETKGIIDPLLGAHNEQPDDQYSLQQGTRANILSQENALDLTPVLRIKYPEIKLPTFSGDNDSWEEFWDTYSLIVDKNPQLGDLEKILHLKDALRNQALDAVKSISKKAEYYKLLVDVLHKKFGNKKIDNISMGTLLDALEKAVSSRVIFERRVNSITRPQLRINTMQQRGPIPAQCLFCRRTNHNSRDCRTVANAADRRKALRGILACWKCFSTTHRSRECNSNNCRLCNGDHHISLCAMQPTAPQPPFNKQNTSSQAPSPFQRKEQQRSNYRNQQGHAAVMSTKETNTFEKDSHAIADQQNTVSTLSAQNEKEGHENSSQFVLMTAEPQVKSEATGADFLGHWCPVQPH